MSIKNDFTTPINGRLVSGSIHEIQTKDYNGQPSLNKEGEPKNYWFFAVAIPKTGTHWSRTEWGSVIWEVGVQYYGEEIAKSENFAWKIIDGDSIELDDNGKPLNTRIGYAKHWVVKFKSYYKEPTTIDARTPKPHKILQDKIFLGDYIQVYAKVEPNKITTKDQRGVYINPIHVGLNALGERIYAHLSPDEVGFGGEVTALEKINDNLKNTTATPTYNKPPVSEVKPSNSVATYNTPPIANTVTAYKAAPPPYTPILDPNQRMTAKATGTYEQYKAQGWPDEALIEQGFMMP